MAVNVQKVVKPGVSIFGGIIFVVMLSGFFRPIQNDLGHAVGFANMEGGTVLHPVHYVKGESLFGWFTMFITAKIIPPVQGDFIIEVEGAEALEYVVSSRLPPGVPLLNRGHAWFSFQDGVHNGVLPGDDLIIVVRMRPPTEPGEYLIHLKNQQSGQTILSVPTIFELTKDKTGIAQEECH